MSDFKTIIFEKDGPIAVITLNRPKAANGLNAVLSSELAQAAKLCDNDATIKAVVLTGNGRFFCAGGDIKEMASAGDNVGAAVKQLADNLHVGISVFSRMDAPLITAVNGMAAGAGFSLAITGDIVLSSDEAKYTMAYTKAGLSPDGSSSYFLPRIVGMRRAQELMLTNRMLDAQEALDWGLVTRIVAADKLMEEAMKLANDLAAGSMGANAAVKKLLLSSYNKLSSYNNTIETQMELEGREISERAISSDGREGIAAFTEKRTPKFS